MEANQSTGAPVKKRSGCKTGCLIILFIILLSIAALFYIVNRGLNSVVESMTTTTPIAVTVVSVDPAVAASATTKFDNAHSAFEHDQPIDVRFTASEVNNLIASHPDFEILRGKIYVELKDNSADVSFNFPLGLITETFPKLKWLGFDVTGRHMNGRTVGSFALRGEEFLMKIAELEFNGQRAPAEVISQLNDGLVKKGAVDSKNPEVKEFFDKIEVIAVENGELVVKSKGSLG